MSANPQPQLDAETYLALDRAAEWKSDFVDGEMFPIETASLRHSRIFQNLIIASGLRLRGTPCEGLPAPLRVRVSPTRYLYPDYLIVCGKPELTDESADTIANPKIIIEILSPSTTDYDHGAKFELYRSIPSLEEYVLISQSAPLVEVFTKHSTHTWSLTIVDDPAQPVRLQAAAIEFPLAELYTGLDEF